MDLMEQDGDVEIEAKLLEQFSSMGTTDRDVLIYEFQKLLENKLNPATCAFYLDMNNWNLQAAVCSYLDYQEPLLPSMKFIENVSTDVTNEVLPDTTFIKTWKVKNESSDTWPHGCYLKYQSGERMSSVDRVSVYPLAAMEERNVSVEMTSPKTEGFHECVWQMCTATGHQYGDLLRCSINVSHSPSVSLKLDQPIITNDKSHDVVMETVSVNDSSSHLTTRDRTAQGAVRSTFLESQPLPQSTLSSPDMDDFDMVT